MPVEVSFGDNVKVLADPDTTLHGVACKMGRVQGMTTPSITGVEVIGELTEDYAVNVSFEEIEGEFWFATESLEFIDHGAGTEIVIGDLKAIRNENGTWNETHTTPTTQKKWWQFW